MEKSVTYKYYVVSSDNTWTETSAETAVAAISRGEIVNVTGTDSEGATESCIANVRNWEMPLDAAWKELEEAELKVYRVLTTQVYFAVLDDLGNEVYSGVTDKDEQAENKLIAIGHIDIVAKAPDGRILVRRRIQAPLTYNGLILRSEVHALLLPEFKPVADAARDEIIT